MVRVNIARETSACPRCNAKVGLALAYKAAPRRFHRDIVLIARKTAEGPSLQPLTHTAQPGRDAER
ncbi:MAG: hypothetical protein NVS1B6_17360 [Steroidobacteraceae bacterium]